jgi:F0F1-type ATP synthase epsilon subunit
MYYISGGYIKVLANQVSIMPDITLEPNQVDASKAKADLETFRAKLSEVCDEYAVSKLLLEIKEAESKIEFSRKEKLD